MDLPTNCEPAKLVESFYGWVKREIESSGEYRMANAVWFDSEKDGVVVEALDLTAEQIVLRCVNTIDAGNCSFMIFGLDMSARPDQGIEFDDFVLVFQWQSDRPEPLKNQLRIGVVNYRKVEQPIVREIDWSNAYWCGHAFNLVREFVPFRVRVQHAAK